MKINHQVVGNAGLYFTCYHLSLLGWNVMPTARNAKGIDIIAYNENQSRFLGIQVKSLSKKDPVPLGNSIDQLLGDFWIVVNNLLQTPNVFILLPDEVKQLAQKGEKNGNVSYWLQPNLYQVEGFQNRWDRIGRGDNN